MFVAAVQFRLKKQCALPPSRIIRARGFAVFVLIRAWQVDEGVTDNLLLISPSFCVFSSRYRMFCECIKRDLFLVFWQYFDNLSS